MAAGRTCGPVSRCLPDPGDMTPDARLSELGELLARGYRRSRLRQNKLADPAKRERPCDSVDTPENPTDQEVA